MRVDFYHLETQTLDQVLPKLVEKAFETGKRIKIKVGTEERVEFINSLLWTYNETSFIPHGSSKDGFAEMQPIWLTSNDKNPGNAEILFLVDGANPDTENAFERTINIFDGNDPTSLSQAREYWKSLKSDNIESTYWKQTSSGRWEKK